MFATVKLCLSDVISFHAVTKFSEQSAENLPFSQNLVYISKFSCCSEPNSYYTIKVISYIIAVSTAVLLLYLRKSNFKCFVLS